MSMKTLAARLEYAGGNQLGRINKQKLKGLQAALKNDYNSRTIKTPKDEICSCLINTNSIKADYDKKFISVEFDKGLEAGDAFQILDDDTHWMVYLPILTETAYLRAEILRCRYQLDVDGELFWIYFQGPTETDLRWGMKQNNIYNELNLSGTVYIKNTPKTKQHFKRFTHLKIDGHTWEVQVTDSITVPGIIELEIQEYYDNFSKELPEIIMEDCKSQIIGTTSISAGEICGYSIQDKYYNKDYIWTLGDNDKVQILETYQENRQCKIKVDSDATEFFQIQYGNDSLVYKLNVKINTLDSYIEGSTKVHPYDITTYAANDNGEFWLETQLAKITEQGEKTCKVEILTGKKGDFKLYFKSNRDDKVHELSISIQSF